MTPRRFKLEIDGTVFHCAAFESEAALEQVLAMSPAPTLGSSTLPTEEHVDTEPRPRGRPSFDDALTAAVEMLGARLNGRLSLAERVRRVLRHLADTRDASEIPARRTVERFLAENPTRQKTRRKSRQKSSRARIARTGGD